MKSTFKTALNRHLIGAIYIIAFGCGTQVGNPTGTDVQPKKNKETKETKETKASPVSSTDPLNFPEESANGPATQSGTAPSVGNSAGTIAKCAAKSNVTAATSSESPGKISLSFSDPATEPITVSVTAPDSTVTKSNVVTPLLNGIYQVTVSRGTTKSCSLKIKIDQTTLFSLVNITISDI
jgi:hypothetical protein